MGGLEGTIPDPSQSFPHPLFSSVPPLHIDRGVHRVLLTFSSCCCTSTHTVVGSDPFRFRLRQTPSFFTNSIAPLLVPHFRNVINRNGRTRDLSRFTIPCQHSVARAITKMRTFGPVSGTDSWNRNGLSLFAPLHGTATATTATPVVAVIASTTMDAPASLSLSFSVCVCISIDELVLHVK